MSNFMEGGTFEWEDCFFTSIKIAENCHHLPQCFCVREQREKLKREKEKIMRDLRSTNSSTSFWTWKSPLPYLFGSLGILLLLIVVALIVLACSFHQRLSSNSDQEKSACPPPNNTIVEMSPRIIVIMAGDHKPTHIGVPTSDKSTQSPL